MFWNFDLNAKTKFMKSTLKYGIETKQNLSKGKETQMEIQTTKHLSHFFRE